jgi:hypothetical protein
MHVYPELIVQHSHHTITEDALADFHKSGNTVPRRRVSAQVACRAVPVIGTMLVRLVDQRACCTYHDMCMSMHVFMSSLSFCFTGPCIRAGKSENVSYLVAVNDQM